jgi:hypothetical protein
MSSMNRLGWASTLTSIYTTQPGSVSASISRSPQTLVPGKKKKYCGSKLKFPLTRVVIAQVGCVGVGVGVGRSPNGKDAV